ncbi:MAG: RNA polymerase sigma factor [Pseudomonadota bacterium]
MAGELIELSMLGRGDRPTDPDLAAAAAEGDRAAFEELVKRHQGVVRSMMRKLTRGAMDADDLAQAAFLSAWRGIRSYSGGAFRSWLCAIAYRELLQARRKRPVGREVDLEAAPDAAYETPLGARLDLDRALAALPEEQRVAIVLCVAAGMSHSEVSVATGWPLGTVKSHVARGKDKLKAALGAYAAA